MPLSSGNISFSSSALFYWWPHYRSPPALTSNPGSSGWCILVSCRTNIWHICLFLYQRQDFFGAPTYRVSKLDAIEMWLIWSKWTLDANGCMCLAFICSPPLACWGRWNLTVALQSFHSCSDFWLYLWTCSGRVKTLEATGAAPIQPYCPCLARRQLLGTVYKERLIVRTAQKAQETLWAPSVKLSCSKNLLN